MTDSIQYTQKPKMGEPWDVAIMGSGPASFTAAIYTTRGAASTLILAGEKWGGQLMLTTIVDNYPGFPDGIQGPDLMMAMRKQTEKFGAEIIQRNVESIVVDKKPFELTAGGQKYIANSVIVATGAEAMWLGVPGEEKLRGRGVSTCAPCDAPFFKGKEVVVVGGGDAAMEEALVLTKFSPKVTVIHRRDTFKASRAMQKRLFNEVKQNKARIIWDTEVIGVTGESVIGSIKLKTELNSKQSEELKGAKLDELKGKMMEEKDGYMYWEMPTQGMFVAIGHKPSSEIFQGELELDERGYVVVHDKTRTSVRGIFVAGDIHDYHYRQAITAAGFGCQAGMDVLKYLDSLNQSSS